MVFDVGALLIVVVLVVCATAGDSIAAAAAVKQCNFPSGVFIFVGVPFGFLTPRALSKTNMQCYWTIRSLREIYLWWSCATQKCELG